MKEIAADVAPILTELVDHLPSIYKEAFITPIIKKPGLDAADVKSYRPISNLSVVSKLLERMVARQVSAYLQSAKLTITFQYGFRVGFSAENAVLRVLSDMLEPIDGADVASLVILDLSAAFDTVNHEILCRQLQTTLGMSGLVIDWFRSYLQGRTQQVRHGSSPN